MERPFLQAVSSSSSSGAQCVLSNALRHPSVAAVSCAASRVAHRAVGTSISDGSVVFGTSVSSSSSSLPRRETNQNASFSQRHASNFVSPIRYNIPFPKRSSVSFSDFFRFPGRGTSTSSVSSFLADHPAVFNALWDPRISDSQNYRSGSGNRFFSSNTGSSSSGSGTSPGSSTAPTVNTASASIKTPDDQNNRDPPPEHGFKGKRKSISSNRSGSPNRSSSTMSKKNSGGKKRPTFLTNLQDGAWRLATKIPGWTMLAMKKLLQWTWQATKFTGRVTWKLIRDPKIVHVWWADCKEAVRHTVKWAKTGFRLFGLNIKVSFKLVKRSLQGYPLSFRDRKLLVKTTNDIGKIIPFSFFFIIPFAELLLPFALRLFPNMMPSTFFEKDYDSGTLARKLKAKRELAQFFQEVVDEKTKEEIMRAPQDQTVEDLQNEFAKFQEKLENHEWPSAKEVLVFAKQFHHYFNFDNLQETQLRAMAETLGIEVFSHYKTHLSIALRHHVTKLRREDREILWEGVSSLGTEELIDACRARAIPFADVDEGIMRDGLRNWLNLSGHKSIPIAMILWIQTYYLAAEAADTAAKSGGFTGTAFSGTGTSKSTGTVDTSGTGTITGTGTANIADKAKDLKLKDSDIAEAAAVSKQLADAAEQAEVLDGVDGTGRTGTGLKTGIGGIKSGFKTAPGQPSVHGKIESVSLEDLAKSSVDDLPELMEGNKKLKEALEQGKIKEKATTTGVGAGVTGAPGVGPAGVGQTTTGVGQTTTPGTGEDSTSTTSTTSTPTASTEEKEPSSAPQKMAQAAKKAAEEFLTKKSEEDDLEQQKKREEKKRMLKRFESQAEKRLQELTEELVHIEKDDADIKAGIDPEEVAERHDAAERQGKDQMEGGSGEGSDVFDKKKSGDRMDGDDNDTSGRRGGEADGDVSSRGGSGPESEILKGTKDEFIKPDYANETLGKSKYDQESRSSTISSLDHDTSRSNDTSRMNDEEIHAPKRVSRAELVKQLTTQEQEIDFLNAIVERQGDLLFEQLKLLGALRETNEKAKTSNTSDMMDETERLRKVIFDSNLRLLEGLGGFGGALKEIERDFIDGTEGATEGQRARTRELLEAVRALDENVTMAEQEEKVAARTTSNNGGN